VVSGSCVKECETPEDCPVENDELEVSRCDNSGRCKISPRPPRLRVLDPENDSLLPEGTRSVRLAGEVDTASDEVTIDITPIQRTGCFAGESRRISVKNPQLGHRVTLSFVAEDIHLDPGLTTLLVRADVGGANDVLEHIVEIPCDGCAKITIAHPTLPFTAPGLVLPRLYGSIEPASVMTMLWRVRGEGGDVFDGSAPVIGGRFQVIGIPLFAGFNRVELLVSGVGQGLGESRCTAAVTSAVAREKGLRAMLTWDGRTSDLDLHMVGPGGRIGDPMSSLSSRSRMPSFGGTLLDDFDGYGPEVITAESLPDGTYGFAVEPVFDDLDPGSNAIVRVLWAGKQKTSGPVGPAFVSSDVGELWIVGTLTVSDGDAEWRSLNDLVQVPPSTPPEEWPAYQ
jgi:hypothetical protein